VVFGGAFPQVIANVARPRLGIVVTLIASGPVQPGLERPNAETPVGSMSSRLTNPSVTLFKLRSNAPGVVGKSEESVHPATVAAPCASMARALARSPALPDPPRNVE
jgi:hypothetical protein